MTPNLASLSGRIIVATCFLLLLASLSPSLAVRGEDAAVGTAVYEQLNAEGTVFVVVALAEPPAQSAAVLDLNALRAQVAEYQAQVLATVAGTDFNVTHRYRAVPALAGIATAAGIDHLAAHPLVRRIDVDSGGSADLGDSVPLIEADIWHGLGVTGNGVTVAILDTGTDPAHPDLGTGLVHEACFLDDDGSINGAGLCPNGSDRQTGTGAAAAGNFHGPFVEGIVTGDGNVASVGVAPDADIVAIKVLDNSGAAGTFYFFSEIVAALDHIINNLPEVDVINMSFSTFAQFSGVCDSSTSWTMSGAAAISTLRAQGVTPFAASGNSGSGTEMGAPACLSGVIAVGATNDSDIVASFTQSNGQTALMAPGVDIISVNATFLGGGTTSGSGTSFAAPHAAGCAALLIDGNVATTPTDIETYMVGSSVIVTDTTNGLSFPRLDCYRPVPTAVQSQPATVASPGDHIAFVVPALLALLTLIAALSGRYRLRRRKWPIHPG